MRNWLNCLALAALLSVCNLSAQSSLNVSTGLDLALKSPLPVGASDPNWLLTDSPLKTESQHPFVIAPPHRSGYVMTPGSNWISWKSEARGVKPGRFRFERGFFHHSSGPVSITLQVWADDLAEISLASSDSEQTIKLGRAAGHKAATPVIKTIKDLPIGQFRLTADLYDSEQVAMGLKIEGAISGDVAFDSVGMHKSTPLLSHDSLKVELRPHIPFPERILLVPIEIHVSQPEISIGIFDKNKVDGDVISLWLNDDWVLQELQLQKNKTTVQIKVDQAKSENILKIFAISTGSVGPCTVAILVADGKKSQTVQLRSDLTKSASIRFVYDSKK